MMDFTNLGSLGEDIKRSFEAARDSLPLEMRSELNKAWSEMMGVVDSTDMTVEERLNKLKEIQSKYADQNK